MSSLKVPQRPMGSQGLIASAQGLGCMGMTAFYGNFDRVAQEAESLRTIATALELGINLLDTAWVYQHWDANTSTLFTNEELVGKALKIHGRDKFVLCTKFGIMVGNQGVIGTSGKEELILTQLQESLTRLDTDYIDLYYMHRMDPTTPIEETMAVLKRLVQEGKIRYIGLSECTPDELRRAHAVHPITAIQMEWSLQTRDIENALVPVARELGVAIVPYSPLGRGFLTAQSSFDSLSESDWRKKLPRFSGDNLEDNKRRSSGFFTIAEEKQCSPAQLALAWVHAQGEDVFPIPGTKSSTRIRENAGAVGISLSAEDVVAVGQSVEPLLGDRYPDMKSTYNTRM